MLIRKIAGINACLNNNECDLVRMTKIPGIDYNSIKCELLKWNKLPDNIDTYSTNLLRGWLSNPATQVDGASNNIYLGSHLINANEEYDQSTREGVVNWFERIVGGQNLQFANRNSRGMDVGELDENVNDMKRCIGNLTVERDGFRDETKELNQAK